MSLWINSTEVRNIRIIHLKIVVYFYAPVSFIRLVSNIVHQHTKTSIIAEFASIHIFSIFMTVVGNALVYYFKDD